MSMVSAICRKDSNKKRYRLIGKMITTEIPNLHVSLAVQFVPPLSCASPVRGGEPSPSARRERSVRLRSEEVGLAVVQVGLAGSEWVELRLGALEPAAMVAPDDGGHLLALDEHAPSCPHRHGYDTETNDSSERAGFCRCSQCLIMFIKALKW